MFLLAQQYGQSCSSKENSMYRCSVVIVGKRVWKADHMNRHDAYSSLVAEPVPRTSYACPFGVDDLKDDRLTFRRNQVR